MSKLRMFLRHFYRLAISQSLALPGGGELSLLISCRKKAPAAIIFDEEFNVFPFYDVMALHRDREIHRA